MSKAKTIGYIQACYKMGGNVISYNELIKFLNYWNFYMEPAVLNTLRFKKFCKETLEKYKETHYLIPVPPISLLDLSFKCTKLELKSLSGNFFVHSDNLTAISSSSHWFLVRKEPIAMNTDQITQSQQRDTSDINLENEEIVATAIVAVFIELLVRHTKKTPFMNKNEIFLPREDMLLFKLNTELSSKIYLRERDHKHAQDEKTALVPTMIRV